MAKKIEQPKSKSCGTKNSSSENLQSSAPQAGRWWGDKFTSSKLFIIFSIVIAYLLIIGILPFLPFLPFFDSSFSFNKIATAFGTGSFFIITGELFRSIYEKYIPNLKEKESKSKLKNILLFIINILLFLVLIIGFFFIIIGFFSIPVVLLYGPMYNVLYKFQSLLTIFSFFMSIIVVISNKHVVSLFVVVVFLVLLPLYIEAKKLTGEVEILKTVKVGGTLTANTDKLGGSGEIFYQWNKDGNAITDKNSSTYIVQGRR